MNPSSGNRQSDFKIAWTLGYFERHGIEVELARTEGPGHAGQLATAAVAAGYRVVVAAGGDGTINEVLGALAGTDCALGILPWGTGNVFAREAGFPRTLRAQCKVIRKGRTRVLDTAVCSGKHFFLMAGAGFDAYSLAQLHDGRLKKGLGLLAYVVGGVRALVRYRYPDIEVELPDGRTDAGSFVLVSNTRLYGAFFRFHPDGDPADGLLDIFVLRRKGPGHLVSVILRLVWTALFPGAMAQWLMFLRRQGVYRCSSVTLRSKAAVPLQLDGDFHGHLPATITVDPASLRVIVPKRYTTVAR